jgi:predicted RecA/RadA family phage recombinase
MAKTYVQPGKVLTLTAPYDRLSAGLGAQVGSIFGVSLGIVLSGAEGQFATTGVWTLAKTSAQAWTVGQKIYWDNTNKVCDSTNTVGQLIGIATAVAANPSSTGTVRLNGVAPVTLAPLYPVTTIPGDGAITIATGIVALTKGSAAAITLAAPTAEQAGTELIITAGSAYAHVVTATGLIEDGVTGGSKGTLTFGAFNGATITLRAYNLKWTVVSKNVVTIT